MSEYDLQKYRQAKVIVKDLEELRRLLKVSFKDLNKYKKYNPIKPILNEILSAEVILKLFHDKNKEILKTKGKVDEEKS
jgi:hypothetical protein